ncbi:MAG: recombinase family protein [Acidobacteriota bacterium]|nr:recombinase family protein [Acidobacteriota bacterium]
MVIGYARVSGQKQNLQLQLDALQKVKCERIFEEHISAGRKQRAQLIAATDVLREGDTFVVWRLDRLGRKMLRAESDEIVQLSTGACASSRSPNM